MQAPYWKQKQQQLKRSTVGSELAELAQLKRNTASLSKEFQVGRLRSQGQMWVGTTEGVRRREALH
jgi:hypothetical protein